MMRTNGRSQAIFGGLLWGDRPLRFVFMDEAGTSQNEPVTVIVGLIANADEHVMSGEALVAEILGGVPEKYRDGFVFHAMDVYGNPKYQKDNAWSLTDRLNLLTEMMSVPRRIGMAISLAAHWRGSVDWANKPAGISSAQFDHFQAFALCVAVADRNIRRNAGPREVATIVAEDVPEMRNFLRLAPGMYRKHPVFLAPSGLRTTLRDEEAGYITQSGDLRVSRIRNTVHFVEKADDPLVQVADACAYGFRRYFAGEKFGQEFGRAILGGNYDSLKNFTSPGGSECYWPNAALA